MGEYAEMMLDGTYCQSCGEFLNGGEDGEGFPMFCAGCQPKDGGGLFAPNKKKKSNQPKIKCPLCERLIKKTGLGDHVQDAHYNKQVTA